MLVKQGDRRQYHLREQYVRRFRVLKVYLEYFRRAGWCGRYEGQVLKDLTYQTEKLDCVP